MIVAAGTPPAVIQSLNSVVNGALKTPALREAIESAGGIVVGCMPEIHAKFLDTARGKWRESIKTANTTLDQSARWAPGVVGLLDRAVSTPKRALTRPKSSRF